MIAATKIELSEEVVKRCRAFAEEVVHTNIDQYKRRNQGNPTKIIEQIVTGKMGEFAFSQFLGTAEPDLQIYAKKQKSFGADLTHDNLQVHVKSQSKNSADKYGVSWSFQVQDKLITQPKEEDFLGLCVIEGNVVEIYDFIPATKVVGVLREPVLPQLRFTKRVLYWEDLKKILNVPNKEVEGAE